MHAKLLTSGETFSTKEMAPEKASVQRIWRESEAAPFVSS